MQGEKGAADTEGPPGRKKLENGWGLEFSRRGCKVIVDI